MSTIKKRRKTPTVKVGNVCLGSEYPVVIQSMTNTLTADEDATVKQIIELKKAGSEIVRLTVNDGDSARAVSNIVKKIKDQGCIVPIVGDFHFQGHHLLNKYSDCAKALDKYRINPGNLGIADGHDKNFETILKIAIENDKPVRIGVNSGSIDKEILNKLSKDDNKVQEDIIAEAMIQSVLESANFARKIGLAEDKIVLSVKASSVPLMIKVYTKLAAQCNYVLHLGLTEAGSNWQGIMASAVGLGVLLEQGIGDTIRISLTPDANTGRQREVEACRFLLQSLGLRYFMPRIISCPGCGRTNNELLQSLTQEVRKYVEERFDYWKEKYCEEKLVNLKIAVMGCVVNGPGESRYADIGICLPGRMEEGQEVVVFYNGKKTDIMLYTNNIFEQINAKINEYIDKFMKF